MPRFLYSTRMLLQDGAISTAELARSSSESTAARAALRAANNFKHDTCVVCWDTYKNVEKIVQRITYLPMEQK